ncbi:hypothetical protein TWF281_004820 [Arthrobotrys megalospora]
MEQSSAAERPENSEAMGLEALVHDTGEGGLEQTATPESKHETVLESAIDSAQESVIEPTSEPQYQQTQKSSTDITPESNAGPAEISPTEMRLDREAEGVHSPSTEPVSNTEVESDSDFESEPVSPKTLAQDKRKRVLMPLPVHSNSTGATAGPRLPLDLDAASVERNGSHILQEALDRLKYSDEEWQIGIEPSEPVVPYFYDFTRQVSPAPTPRSIIRKIVRACRADRRAIPRYCKKTYRSEKFSLYVTILSFLGAFWSLGCDVQLYFSIPNLRIQRIVGTKKLVWGCLYPTGEVVWDPGCKRSLFQRFYTVIGLTAAAFAVHMYLIWRWNAPWHPPKSIPKFWNSILVLFSVAHFVMFFWAVYMFEGFSGRNAKVGKPFGYDGLYAGS